MKRRTSIQPIELPEIGWHHHGTLHRIRLAREDEPGWVVFEVQNEDGDWTPFEPEPMSEMFTSAALVLNEGDWRALVRELPYSVQEFLAGFHFERLEALAVAAHCPELLPSLEAAPALTLFLAAHAALRGTDQARWGEINAVADRSGIFGVLEWLGLPATPQTLATLAKLPDPEIPRHELGPVRTGLWCAAGLHPLAA